MKSIDFKSMLIGFLSCMVVFTILGAKESNTNNLGRYMASCMGPKGLHCMVLDTTSGQFIGRVQWNNMKKRKDELIAPIAQD